MNEQRLRALIRDIPDFPAPGVIFKDITPVLADHEAMTAMIDDLIEPFRTSGVTKVAGIEARGFILAAPVALRLDAGVVPIRKAGKLPYETYRQDYTLEYGTDALEVHIDAVDERDVVLIIDDVLATGGTAAAANQLIADRGAGIAGVSVMIELVFLNGRSRLNGTPVHSLVRYE